MRLSDTLILLYFGGLGSGCRGENCGRHSLVQQKVTVDLLIQHDRIFSNPKRDYVFNNKKTANQTDWHTLCHSQQERIESLMDNVTDASNNSNVRSLVRDTAKLLDSSKKELAKSAPDYDRASVDQELALSSLHKAIKEIERYPSSIRQRRSAA